MADRWEPLGIAAEWKCKIVLNALNWFAYKGQCGARNAVAGEAASEEASKTSALI